MDPEDKSTLRKVLELEQKNNNLLNALYKSMFWGRIFRVIYWIVIAGVAIGAYYYVEPYVNSLTDAYGSFKSDIQHVKNVFSSTTSTK